MDFGVYKGRVWCLWFFDSRGRFQVEDAETNCQEMSNMKGEGLKENNRVGTGGLPLFMI